MSLVNSTNEEEQNEKTGKENCSVFDGYGSVYGIYDDGNWRQILYRQHIVDGQSGRQRPFWHKDMDGD